jgi:hypothetical protein
MIDPLNEQRTNELPLKNNPKAVNKAVTKCTKENKVVAARVRSQSKALKAVVVVPPPACLSDNIIHQTNAIRLCFLNEMLSFELSKSPESLRCDFLKRHRISPEIRARMVG